MNFRQMHKVYYKWPFLFFILVLLCSPGVTLGQIEVKTENVTCHEKEDGKVTITVKEVTGDFRYSISKDCFLIFECDEPYQSSNEFTDLEPGKYLAKVKDMETECEFSKEFTIEEPTELTIEVSGGGDVNFQECDGKPTITLSATASGGTPKYDYSWPDGKLEVNSDGAYKCTVTDSSGCKAEESVTLRFVEIVCSKDPNDIIGPKGVGDEKWVSKNDILPYTIRYENDPVFATAPAQLVKIVHPLDANVNVNSLRLGNFGFANQVFEVPQNRTFYTARLDVMKTLGVAVDVTAGIDVTKREAFWIFESVDPATGLPPQQANLGFLPLNDSTGIGEGFVNYIIKPASHTRTGDTIFAEADIIFDINEPILTPVVFNTIDALPPSTEINSVPTELHVDSTLNISVSGSDDTGGSGLASNDLFISENGAPFQLLTSNLPEDSVYQFQGKEATNYCLYSVSRDWVNNLEARSSTADVCFSVPRNASLDLVSPKGGEIICANDTLTIAWKAKSVYDVNIYVSADGVNYEPIALAVPTYDSSHTWKIPPHIAAGSDYRIKIADLTDSTMYSVSAGTFIINKALAPVISASNGIVLCSGDSTLLDAGTDYFAYLWSSGDTTQQISVASSGLYVVEAMDLNGCKGKDTVSITVNSTPMQPLVYYNQQTANCYGDTTSLSAAPGFDKYLWSTGDTTETITVETSGIYFVQVSNSNGCFSPESELVHLSFSPVPEKPVINVAGDTAICAGGYVRLNAPTGFAYYSWTHGAGNASVAVSDTGSYAVAVIDSSGCSSVYSDSVQVIEKPVTPQASIIANGPVTFCEGDSVILSAGAGYQAYTWSTGDTTETITVSHSGEYVVAVQLTGACLSTYSDSVTVTVLPNPAQPMIAAGGPVSFCEGDSVVLSAEAGMPAYKWSTGETSSLITVKVSGSYTAVVFDSSGCASAASAPMEVMVNTLPEQPMVVSSGNTTFCSGDSVGLSAPAGFASYSWSNGINTQLVTVTESGLYTVIVTNDSGCVSQVSEAVAVTVNPLPGKPVIAVTGSTTFCEGDSVNLVGPAGYVNYYWSDSSASESILIETFGSYSLVVEDANGCLSPSSDTVNIQTLPLPVQPVVEASGPVVFCEGEDVILSAPEGFAGYEWSTGEISDSIIVSTSGSYSVKITNDQGCISYSSEPVVVTVLSNPTQPVITANGPLAFCEGGSVILSAPTGFSGYEWSDGITNQSVTVAADDTLSVKVTDFNGCSSTYSEPTIVAVYPLPVKPIVTLEGADTLYAGETALLHAPQGFAGYLWSTEDTTASITVDATASYNVQVINENGCVSPASDPIQIVAIPRPPKPTITVNGTTAFCDGGSVTLIAPAGYTEYLWSNGAVSQTIEAVISGNYTVVVTDHYGLSSYPSDSVEVEVYPSPARPAIQIIGDTVLCNRETVTLSAPTGFYGYLWSGGETSQSIEVFGAGVYSVEVFTEFGCRSGVSDSVVIARTPDLFVYAGDNQKSYYYWGDTLPELPFIPCATLTANVLAVGSGTYSLKWNTGVEGDTLKVCPSEDTWYSVTISDDLGCEYTDQVKVCAIDVSCIGEDVNGQYVDICYLPESGTSQSLCVPLGKAEYYLRKPGHFLGACEYAGPCLGSDSASMAAPAYPIGDEEESQVILQAIPNPFATTTKIHFRIPETEQVRVEVFMFAGIKVADLYDGLAEGERDYELIYTPTNEVRNGLYIVKLTTATGKVYTIKLILSK